MQASDSNAEPLLLANSARAGSDLAGTFAAAMLDAAPAALLLVDSAGLLHYANGSAQEMLSRRADSAPQPLTDFIPVHFHETFHAMLAAVSGGEPISQACQLIALKSDGTPFSAELCLALMDSPAGLLCASLRPIEVPSAAECTLDSTRLMLERVIEEHPNMLVVRDGTGRIVLVNNKLARYYDMSAQEMVGQYHQELWRKLGISEELIEAWIAEDQEVLRHGGTLDYVQHYDGAGSGSGWYHNLKTMMRLADGTPCVLVTYADITPRKEIEEALRSSESRFRTVFENAAVGIAVVTREGRYIQANNVFQQLLGYSLAELLEVNAFDLTPPEDWPTTRPLFESLLSGERASFMTEKRYIRKDGSLIWLDLWATPLYDSEGQVDAVLGIFADITERRRQHSERERLIEELSEALMTVKTLSGLVPICSSCKKVRDDKGFWNQLEEYLSRHSDARLSHGLCPDCVETMFPELALGEDEARP